MSKFLSALLGLAYVLMIPLAAWVVKQFGVVEIGLGLMAPAAVFVIGFILVVRDVLQDRLTRDSSTAAAAGVIAFLIVVGTTLAIMVDPVFGIASGVAFALSETFDLAVYTPLRKRGRFGAILVSNAVAIAVDSVVFLWLAFGSLQFLWGQVYGKALATLVAMGLLAVIHERRTRRQFNVSRYSIDSGAWSDGVSR